MIHWDRRGPSAWSLDGRAVRAPTGLRNTEPAKLMPARALENWSEASETVTQSVYVVRPFTRFRERK